MRWPKRFFHATVFGPPTSSRQAKEMASLQFALDLEQCIRGAAANAVKAWPEWGDGCLAATTKVDRQAAVLGESITPFEAKYGYQAALWCTFYSTRMTEEPNPDNPQ